MSIPLAKPYGRILNILQWLVMVLYGIAATLLAYCASLFMPSPLASFAATAGYQAVMFLVCEVCDSWSMLTRARTGLLDRIPDYTHLRPILQSG